jgi:hypothetical protein
MPTAGPEDIGNEAVAPRLSSLNSSNSDMYRTAPDRRIGPVNPDPNATGDITAGTNFNPDRQTRNMPHPGIDAPVNTGTEWVQPSDLYDANDASRHTQEPDDYRYVSNNDTSSDILHGPDYFEPTPPEDYRRDQDWINRGDNYKPVGQDDPLNNLPETVYEPPPGDPTVEVKWDAGNRGAPYWNQPPTPRYNPGGTDIANFGSNISLGQFLNTPLSTMLFSTGRWQPPVDAGQVIVGSNNPGRSPSLITNPNDDWTGGDPNAVDLTADNSPEANRNVQDAQARGDAETARLRASGELYPDATTAKVDTASVRPPSGGGGDTRNVAMSPNAYAQATFGGLTPTGFRDTTGSATFDRGAADRLMAWFQSSGGNPNTNSAMEGKDIYRSGLGQVDSEGKITTVAATNSAGAPDSRWVFPSQAEATRLGLSNDPEKRNAWLKAHNGWFYGGG